MCNMKIDLLKFIEQCEMYHWSHVSRLFGWRNVLILSFLVMPARTWLCNSISLICQNNTRFSSSEHKGKSLQEINAFAAGNQDTTRY